MRGFGKQRRIARLFGRNQRDIKQRNGRPKVFNQQYAGIQIQYIRVIRTEIFQKCEGEVERSKNHHPQTPEATAQSKYQNRNAYCRYYIKAPCRRIFVGYVYQRIAQNRRNGIARKRNKKKCFFV